MTELSLDSLLELIAVRLADRVAGKLGQKSGIMPRLLSVEQAAEYLNRSPAAVRHLIATGKLKCVRMDGRVFLDVQDLDQAIDDAKS